jgi:hypothetical protein
MNWLACLLIGAALLVPELALSIPVAKAQPRERCFAETVRCMSGPILEYWERKGGLAVFGYPVSDLRAEAVESSWVGPVQWFERDRLEDHGAEGVLAGRLGARLLEARGYDWLRGERPPSTPPGCRFFHETGYHVCEPFLSYWERNGGLERFGYPLTQPESEAIGGWTGRVQ